MKNILNLLSKTKNKKLLILFPHPDDESVMAAGLIMRAKQLGWHVTVINLTHGEQGRIWVHGKGRSITQIRREEFQAAMKQLSVDTYELWTYPDGKLKANSSWHKKTTNYVNDLNPGIIVSYGPDGVSGHPDHLSLGKVVFEYLKNKKKTIVLWPAFQGIVRDKIINTKVKDRALVPEFEVPISFIEAFKKWRCLKSHKSQAIGKNQPLPLLLVLLLFRNEFFVQADPKKAYDFSNINFDLGI